MSPKYHLFRPSIGVIASLSSSIPSMQLTLIATTSVQVGRKLESTPPLQSCSDELIDPRTLTRRQRGLNRRLGRSGVVGILVGLHIRRLGPGGGRGHGRRRWN